MVQSQVQLVGAEATGFGAEAQAEDNDWILVKHFKLLLHPKELLSKHNIQCPPSKETAGHSNLPPTFDAH